MNNLVYLRCNTEPVMLNNLRTGNGKVFEFLNFFPGELWYDEQGIIRQFSLKFVDGDIGNFFLMPLTQDRNKYLKTIAADLAEFGVKMTANAIFSDNGVILNLAKFLFEKYGKLALSDVINREEPRPMGYVAVGNNEVVFLDKINIQSGINPNSLIFRVKNDYATNVRYESSRDFITWQQGVIPARQTLDLFFSNRQFSGYMRLYTDWKPGKIYKVEARKLYSVKWQEHQQQWDIVQI